MSPKWAMFFFAMFIALNALSSIAEASWFGDTDTLNVINILTNPSIVFESVTSGNLLSIFTVPVNFVLALWKIVTFDYSMFTGEWLIVRLLFMSFSVGFIWGAIQTARGTSS